MPPTVHLYADTLAMRYGRRVLFRALSFEAAGGASLAVTGANGSGKSTLLKILAGVVTPVRGSVRLTLDGAEVPATERPRSVGLAGPYLGLYDGYSARETLAFLADARGLRAAPIIPLLDRVGLGTRADDRVGTFSSGMQQRLRLATALLAAPAVLLLDEPGATLDTEGRALIRALVAEQQAAGTLVIVATNDPAEAALCDQTLVLSHFV
ncbi:MAG: ATP-binding cassette domain-containing protein [Bacteroidota bacterium]